MRPLRSQSCCAAFLLPPASSISSAKSFSADHVGEPKACDDMKRPIPFLVIFWKNNYNSHVLTNKAVRQQHTYVERIDYGMAPSNRPPAYALDQHPNTKYNTRSFGVSPYLTPGA